MGLIWINHGDIMGDIPCGKHTKRCGNHHWKIGKSSINRPWLPVWLVCPRVMGNYGAIWWPPECFQENMWGKIEVQNRWSRSLSMIIYVIFALGMSNDYWIKSFFTIHNSSPKKNGTRSPDFRYFQIEPRPLWFLFEDGGWGQGLWFYHQRSAEGGKESAVSPSEPRCDVMSLCVSPMVQDGVPVRYS